jgi:chitinase
MTSRRIFYALFFVLAITLTAPAQSAHRLVAYYPEWAKFDSPPYSSEQIPYQKLTHIEHAFAALTPAADGTIFIPEGMIEPNLISRAHANGVKVLLSIGGGDGIQGPRFNQMAASETARQNFVANVRTLLTTYGYDGVDIDWEIPGPDYPECTTLMQELRDGLPSPWLISMAVTAEPFSYGGYDIPALTPLVDFFNVMTYDFYGTWSGMTGLVSPLLQDPADPNQNGSVSTSMYIYQTIYGVPVSQLNIGTPFYGYEWDGVDTIWTACPTATCPSYSWNYGTYIEQRINKLGWTEGYDPAARAPYLTNSTIPGFITYDGVESTSLKVSYVKSRGFGGVFMWSIDEDYDGTHQDLLDAMYNAWK